MSKIGGVMAKKSKTKDSLFRKVAHFLRNNAEVEYPIYIRRIKMPYDLDGLCHFTGEHFYIKINKDLSEEHCVDVALHEVAHAMAWDKKGDDHGPNWGIAYSKIYRKFLDDFLENYN